MSETQIIKSWRAGCARQALLVIIIFMVLMVGIVGLTLLAVLLPVPDDQRIKIWLGGLFIFLLLMAGGGMILGVWRRRRRAAQLDTAFIPLGLTGKAYLWNGRQYHGEINGRQADAYFYRGPSLDIYIASPLNTRLGIGLKGRLSQIASSKINRPELVTNDPELAHLGVYPLDDRWGRDLLEESDGKTVILRLTTSRSSFEFRNLLFQPEAIQLQIHFIDFRTITAENLRIWVNDLFDLAGIAESLPAPSVTAVASPIERKTRLNRSDFALPIMRITCGIFAFFTVILIIITLVFFSLASSGY